MSLVPRRLASPSARWHRLYTKPFGWCVMLAIAADALALGGLLPASVSAALGAPLDLCMLWALTRPAI